MDYRIMSGQWRTYHEGQEHTKLMYGGDVVVALDPGKTNMALTVGDPYGIPISYIEITGKGCDTTDYCTDFANFIVEYLSNVNVVMFGVEAAVSYKGMEYHRSQMVLTEIRANLLQMIKTKFHLKPIEINNWSWKHAILPDGYRSQKEKGSYRYLTELGLHGVTHDITDSICMYFYLQRTQLPKYPDPFCDRREVCIIPHKVFLFGENNFAPGDMWHYKYNPQFSLQENVNYYVNRTTKDGYLDVKASDLTLDEIYNTTCVLSSPSENLKVVISRTS